MSGVNISYAGGSMSNMSEKQPIYRSTADERMFERSYLNPEEAHVRAKETLSEYEIKPEIFSDYDPAMIKRDAEEVARLEAIFEPTPSKIYGDILEAVACEHGELSNWFGAKSQVIKTARFDDYKNKIDMVVETEAENRQFSHLALGVDVTFGSNDLHTRSSTLSKRTSTVGDSGRLNTSIQTASTLPVGSRRYLRS